MTNYTLLPNDYKDIFYRITYPLLGKLAPLIPTWIKPNHITYTAFFSSVLACLLLYVVRSPVAYLYWIFFNLIWYVLDALDGIHARRTQQTSEYGGFLDHVLDNIYFIIMFSVFIIKFHLLYPIYLTIIILRITAASIVFISQIHTGKLYVPRFSHGIELILMTTAMFLSYLYPHLNLVAISHNTFLAEISSVFNLSSGVFMKIVLLFYGIALPIGIFFIIQFVRQELVANSSLN